MEIIEEVRSFLEDLIKPIVTEAVKDSISEQNQDVSGKRLMPREEFCTTYGVSNGKLYDLFNSGKLTKKKVDGLTFIDIDEWESLAQERDMVVIRSSKQVRK